MPYYASPSTLLEFEGNIAYFRAYSLGWQTHSFNKMKCIPLTVNEGTYSAKYFIPADTPITWNFKTLYSYVDNQFEELTQFSLSHVCFTCMYDVTSSLYSPTNSRYSTSNIVASIENNKLFLKQDTYAIINKPSRISEDSAFLLCVTPESRLTID